MMDGGWWINIHCGLRELREGDKGGGEMDSLDMMDMMDLLCICISTIFIISSESI